MSPIIDFVRRKLSSSNIAEEDKSVAKKDVSTANNSNGKGVEVESCCKNLLNARSGFFNEGTALDQNKRQKLGLAGLLPAKIESLEIQKSRAMRMLRSKSSMLEKYIFMAQMRTTNINLFYKIVIDELEELAPVIYTPTVGTACLEYSNIYPFLAPPGVPDGLYLSKKDTIDAMCQSIRNYQPIEGYKPEIAVISDGSRILGLGDLGVNGIGIPIGKLQLYVAGAGIDPRRTLPVILDMGTNNERYLNDELYIGLREKRPNNEEEFYSTVDNAINALRTAYPNILIQFEDWSTEHAFELLEKYQNQILCFNDDIQGTGAVILSGVINAIRKVQKEDNVTPSEHRIVFYGAGSAAIGVARQIQGYFQAEHNMTEEEARKAFWIVDSKGLITSTRGDKLAQHKIYYARDDTDGQQYKDLEDIVTYVKPTILIGLSSIPGAFNEKVLSRLAEFNKQPIVFPLSNPATQAECSFKQAMEATKETVIFASGTAFPPYTVESTGELKYPGQGNNMYIFPGLGLGGVVSETKYITDAMIYEAAKALSNSLTEDEMAKGWLYPSLKRIREVSAEVATAVCKQAIKEKLATSEDLLNAKCSTHEDVLRFVSARMWAPHDTDGNQGVFMENGKL